MQFVQNEDPRVRADKVVKALNQVSHLTGVAATNNGGGVSLESDGRNVSIWFDSSRQDLSAASFGLDTGTTVAQESAITIGGTVDPFVIAKQPAKQRGFGLNVL